MLTRSFPRVLALVAVAWLAVCAAPSYADSSEKPANKWRIIFDDRADNDGTIVFRIAPVGKDPIDVETKIPAGTSENHAADILSDSLKASLGKGFHVETDDGEDVLIKRRGDTPKFFVTMVSTSLTGLNVKVKKD